MDGLEPPVAMPLPPDMSDLAPKKPGRPPADPTKRALADERYAMMQSVIGELPETARDPRFAIFRARRRIDQKRNIRPIGRIMFKDYIENNLKEPGSLYSFLRDKYGDGRYWVEAHDAFNHRIDKIPHWIVPEDTAMSHDDDFDDEYDDDEDDDRPRRSRRGFGRRRYRDEPDDGSDHPANVSELLLTANKVGQSNAATQAKSQTDMITMLLMTSQESAKERAAEDRRRDEARKEDARIEAQRSEQRRLEQQEERRRQDDRDERNRKEDQERRNADHLRLIEAANNRTQMIIGGLTALAPILAKVLEKKTDPLHDAMITKALQPPPESPMMGILLKSVVDKGDRKDSGELMMQQLMQMSKMSSEMQAEQLKSMMGTASQFNDQMLKKAMDMMLASPQGQTEEGQDMIANIAKILASAKGMVDAFVPAKPAAPALTAPPAQARRFAPPQSQQRLPAPQSIQATVPPAQPVGAPVPPQQPQPTTTEQKPPTGPPAGPTGMLAVLGGLKAIHLRMYRNQAEQQILTKLVLEQMPVDLRVAVIENDEEQVLKLTLPWIQQVPEFAQWFEFTGGGEGDAALPATIVWVREFVPHLASDLVAVHGPLEQQKAQLAEALAQLGAVPKDQVQQASDQQVPEQPRQVVEPPQSEQPREVEAVQVGPPVGPTVAQSDGQPISGQVVADAQAPQPTDVSHLDPDAP